jgi:hypothetical protein
MTYNDGTAHSCTSNALPLTLLRATQPAQTSGRPPSGNYTGDYFTLGTQGSLTFSVASNRSTIQNFSTDIDVDCTPGNVNTGVTFTIHNIPIASNGSLATTSKQNGTFVGFPASFTYVVQGHAHGNDSAGHPRIAGSVSATVTYTDGVTHTCRSDELPWSATGP